MKNSPPRNINVGDRVSHNVCTPRFAEIMEITETDEKIIFFLGKSIIGYSNKSQKEIRNEIIYFKCDDIWIWTGEDSIQKVSPPKFYTEITKQKDREQLLNKLLE